MQFLYPQNTPNKFRECDTQALKVAWEINFWKFIGAFEFFFFCEKRYFNMIL